MRILATILALALFAGAAGAINYDIVRQVSNDGPTNFVGVELSGTDPAVFDQPAMQKDGLAGGAESDLTSSQTAFLKDGNEIDAKIEGMKVALVGSLAKDLYMDYRGKQEVPDYATQVATYLDERLNRSADLTVIDKLNVTEGNSTEAV